ncbi:Mobile element protein [Burkholderia sp. AU4i]|nr:Mobile element protein [Burkholderia sp. AU4i]
MLERLEAPNRPLHLLMDKAYEGNETRQLALDLGFIPVVPPLGTHVEPWEYDRELYKRRNEVGRPFRRLKGFRRIFPRRQTRSDVHCLYQLRLDRRSPSLA